MKKAAEKGRALTLILRYVTHSFMVAFDELTVAGKCGVCFELWTATHKKTVNAKPGEKA